MEKVKAVGLKWRKLASGMVPYWVADERDVKNGYTPKTVNLSYIADNSELLIAKCNALQAEMLLWRAGYRPDPLAFDGTIRSLLSVYQRNPESPFHTLKPGTLRPYKHYLARIESHIGERRIEAINGVDIKRWHRVWSSEGKHLAAASMARTVLESALTFGVLLRLPGCADLLAIMRETRRQLPRRRPRTVSMTARDVVKARQAAHAAGRPSRALAYALAFETTLRLWDVIGQWWDIDKGGMSDVIDAARGKKWFGLRWEDIGPDLVLRYTPSKTERTTGRTIVYPLSKAPMVLEELANFNGERAGPVIVSEATGKPYQTDNFQALWGKDRKAAGIATDAWARDLRASGITEGRASNVSIDDAARVAGHSRQTSATVYDRAGLEAAERFADARIRGRETKR